MEDYSLFKTEIQKLVDIDLDLYHEKQMRRRLETLVHKLGLASFQEYSALLSRDADALLYFMDYITINVTSFFRNPEHWETMENVALNELFLKQAKLHFWSMACSSGEEAYSLAMLMLEKYPGRDFDILATDIDAQSLQKAKAGAYTAKEMENVPEAYRGKYFTRQGAYYVVNDEVKAKINFQKMDLLKFDYPRNIDLALARNILIYLTNEAKNRIFSSVLESLNPGGYLFTGNTEQIIYYKQAGYLRCHPFLYQKPSQESKTMETPKKTYVKKQRRRSILVVEDNEINREILETILAEDYDVKTAENGLIGYQILSQEYQNLSLVLLDVYMPVMTGFEFLEKVQGDALLSSVPVIVTTSSDKNEDEVKCLKLGASDFVTKPYNPDVVLARVKSIIKLKESVATLSAVEFDPLTGLYTLPAFFHHVEKTLKDNPGVSFDLCIANIKGFKYINTLFGSKKADELLKYIAERYRKQMPFAILARQGDKFYSLYDVSLRFSPEVGLANYVELVENAPVSQLIVKYGVCTDVDSATPASVLCDRALIAAHSIRDDFSETLAFYDVNKDSKLLEDQKMERAFESAMSKGEFVAFYQPKVNPDSGRVEAGEALVRWIQKDGKLVSPGIFVPLFEKDGLITELDEYIFKVVCEYQAKRLKKGQRIVPISINLSRNSIYFKGLVAKYKAIADSLGVPTEYVPIEITESATLDNSVLLNLAESFSKAGFSLHMDDFGTGYSSLSSLAKLPFDVIKLDKSLIDHIGSHKGEVLIKHTISFAQEMGMEVVAEGVETQKQVDFLRKAGCDLIQGYFYSAPKPETVWTAMLDKVEENKLDIQQEYRDVKLSEHPQIEIDENSLKTIQKLGSQMLEGFLIYKATLDETILYANDKLIQMFGCANREEFDAFTGNSFKGIVDPDDYPAVEKSIFQQINSTEHNDDAVEYHIIRKDGSKVHVLDEGHCVYSKVYGNIFYVFIKEN